MEHSGELDVRFFAPPSDLGPCFTTFYRLELRLPKGQRLTDQLQPEWANLRFFSGDPPITYPHDHPPITGTRFTATGPSSRPIAFEMGTTRMWGIGLLPLGWARFVRVPACKHADTVVDGHDSLVFHRFTGLSERLCRAGSDDESDFAAIVAWFRDHAIKGREDDKILAIHEAMIDPYLTQVSDFAEAAGLTKRTLERACLRHFGFSPRILLRRQRLMRSLAAFMLDSSRTWSNAIDSHYHDQAHFVHEFHAFMGMSPTDYARIPHPILSAFMEERQRVWGSPVQTLDSPR